MNHQTFTATWRGEFPLDMLRYDNCFPADSQAVSAIIASITGSSPLRRTAGLARFIRSQRTMPTAERWRSFGASISDIKIS